MVHLSLGRGKIVNFFVSNLGAQAFVQSPTGNNASQLKHQVHYDDGNALDNAADSLSYT